MKYREFAQPVSSEYLTNAEVSAAPLRNSFESSAMRASSLSAR